MLTLIDEYSRFPFAFPCSNINTETVIKCLTQLFSLFGLCSCIHSDRGSVFMSKKFIEFLRGKGIAYSRTSVYNRVVTVNVKSTMTYLVWCQIRFKIAKLAFIKMGRCFDRCIAFYPFLDMHGY